MIAIEEQMQHVKRLIVKKEYAQARTILESLEHPRRDKWLQRLDMIERKRHIDHLPKPAPPLLLALLTFLITPFLSTLFLAVNWRRFDKPRWLWWTIGGGVLMMVGSALMIVASAWVSSRSPINANIAFGIFTFSLIFFIFINLAYPFFIANQQGSALRIAKKKNMLAAYDYRYSWGRSAAIWLTTTTILVGTLIMLMMQVASLDETYEIGTFSTPLQIGWQTSDPHNPDERDYTCAVFNDKCIVVVHSTFYSVLMTYYDDYWVTRDASTLKDMAQVQWDWIIDNPDWTPIERETISIGDYGHAEVLHYYDMDWHCGLIFIQDGSEVRFVYFAAKNDDLLAANWDDMRTMIAQTQWLEH